MSEKTHTDQTLPGLVSALPAQYGPRPLVFTVIFHADSRRIGQRFEVAASSSREPLVIGRNGPVFGSGDPGSRAPIKDPHVSRRALLLRWRGDTLCVARPAGASRAQLGGVELEAEVELDEDRLLRGVPILLAHSVVLLLRYDAPAAGEVPDTGELGLLGCSNYMAGLRRSIRRAARHDEDVLVLGETGTGKELVARAIHGNSARASQSLVPVNMAAIPRDLAAATLFGHAKGAFTGASASGRGYFRQADGGTLFLDEVGDTPPAIQPQLLRALQERQVQAVGGGMYTVSVRVVSATDVPLDSPENNFRSALRHRLGALEIQLLPLRQHPEDIGVLALHFLSPDGHGLPGNPVPDQLQIAQWANLFHQFLRHTWPGNIRELSNACRQVLVNSETGIAVPESLRAALRPADSRLEPVELDSARSIHEVEDAEFDCAWHESRYEPAGTARLLGVSRQSVYRRIDRSEHYRLAGQVRQEELRRVLTECGHDSVEAARRLRVSLSGLRSVLRTTDYPWR